MIGRTAALLVFAATAWGVGAAIAMERHWHPFGGAQGHDGEELWVHVPAKASTGREVVVMRGHSVAVHLTPAERRMLPPGLAVETAERALSAIASRELAERAASHAAIHPGGGRVMLSDQIISRVHVGSHPDFNLAVLWPGVAARLEAAGNLPPHAHWPAESVAHVRPARRPRR